MRTYQCISADSHVQFLAEQYAHRVPEKYRDRLPKLIKLPNGGDGTQSEDGTVTYGGTAHFCGRTLPNASRSKRLLHPRPRFISSGNVMAHSTNR